jgi:C1A family cysteine protease
MPPPVDLEALNPLPLMELLAAPLCLPTSWDWRDHEGVTPVKYQGSCGSCWTFGNIGSLESRYKILTSGHPDKDWSEENMNSCHLPWLWARCEGGNTFTATSYLTNVVMKNATQQFQKGILDEKPDPYKGADSHDNALCKDSKRPLPKYRIEGTRWVANDNTAMKNAIYNHGPIVSAFYAESPGSSHWYEDNTLYHYPGYSGTTNHEVLIVGWDDNKAWPGGGNGAWIVKNSWGTSFNAIGGYFYITYGSARVGSDAMYYTGVRDAATNENFYMEDKPGWITNVGCGLKTGYGATVFKPLNDNEKLTHVEFYNPFSNMPYTIKVWGMVTQLSSKQVKFPAKGLLRTKTGTCKEPGYYVVSVGKNGVALTKGTKYAVEIKFTDLAGGRWPVPCASASTYPGLIGPFAGTGNATNYGRCTDSGPFDRWMISGDPMIPNVRARTTY